MLSLTAIASRAVLEYQEDMRYVGREQDLGRVISPLQIFKAQLHETGHLMVIE
jgi:hypothetical protein